MVYALKKLHKKSSQFQICKVNDFTETINYLGVNLTGVEHMRAHFMYHVTK